MEHEVENETMERVYDSDQDEYFLTHKTKIKTKTETESSEKTKMRVYVPQSGFTNPDEDDHIIKPKHSTKTETKPKAAIPCWVFEETIKNYTALKTHMKKHWRENTAAANDYVIKSSLNHRQIYITRANENLSIKTMNQ